MRGGVENSVLAQGVGGVVVMGVKCATGQPGDGRAGIEPHCPGHAEGLVTSLWAMSRMPQGGT